MDIWWVEKMMKEVDKFLKENFEISLETYFRLTDSKLKNLLKAEIRNYLEINNQEGKTNEKIKKRSSTQQNV